MTVSDTGPGMPEDVRSMVFEPFFTTKPVGEGSGLGLAMVYGLARQHDGMAEIDSEPGGGTRVSLHFPADVDARTEDPAGPIDDGKRAGTETILLAEDEGMLRDVAKQVLEQHGYTVLAAEDGEAALDLFLKAEGKVDLVISDVVMPNMGGIELYHTLKGVRSQVRFLLASGYPGRQSPSGSSMDPTIPFIKKPWRMRDLLTKVREVLDAPDRTTCV
jgi:CheY-like chemotaxis protein